jgi:hypothetical protein
MPTGFEVFRSLKIFLLTFWVVMPCGLAAWHQHFGEIYCLHLQGFIPESGKAYLQFHMVLQHRRSKSVRSYETRRSSDKWKKLIFQLTYYYHGIDLLWGVYNVEGGLGVGN